MIINKSKSKTKIKKNKSVSQTKKGSVSKSKSKKVSLEKPKKSGKKTITYQHETPSQLRDRRGRDRKQRWQRPAAQGVSYTLGHSTAILHK